MARRRPHRGDAPPPREAWGAIHPLLDLHGFRAEGVRTVMLVTGRGMHSAGMRPVLLGEVEDLLRGLKGTLVASFSPLHGGGGFRVELARRPPQPQGPPKPRHTALERADAELRRRAEEALWELGIHPTPALLDAELRRLLKEGGGEP